ncbi:MAG: SGNH/GDSL hydrolase family protein [Planctomycetota bacterium]|jgi:lysophospholipase L1-like esterase
MRPKIELKPNQTILFTGDSITDADRDQPAFRPFGSGYVHFVANLLLAGYPHLNLNIINTGIGGNTIRDLKSRWEKDCLRHKPDVLSVLIGINDLYWQYADSAGFARGVYPDEYELTYKRLLSQVRQRCNLQLVLMEPFMFCDDRENRMFEGLRAYIDIVRKLAKEFDAVLVSLQSRIDEQIKQVPPEKWSADSVHPYVWAHAWIAQCWLEATGL